MNTTAIDKHKIAEWANAHPFSPSHVDCTTTVMLKILDGKCKMYPEEKIVMELLYDCIKDQPGELFGAEFHALIADARTNLDDEMKNHIYEKRVLAETMLSRPVMKGYKAQIRARGLFGAIA